MRNYCTISSNAILSYDVNGGEYCLEVEEALEKAISQLATALVVPRLDVKLALSEFARFGFVRGMPDADRAISRMIDDSDTYVCEHLSPADARVIGQLFEFHANLVRFKDDPYRLRQVTSNGAAVFSYHNLNTGVSCIWIHAVM